MKESPSIDNNVTWYRFNQAGIKKSLVLFIHARIGPARMTTALKYGGIAVPSSVQRDSPCMTPKKQHDSYF